MLFVGIILKTWILFIKVNFAFITVIFLNLTFLRLNFDRNRCAASVSHERSIHTGLLQFDCDRFCAYHFRQLFRICFFICHLNV